MVFRTRTENSKDHFETPPEIWNPLNDRFHFTVDAAASEENALCPVYFTQENSALEALVWGTPDDVVWLNPPYKNISPWLKKAYEQLCTVVCLIPVATATRHWWEYVFPKAAEIIFIVPRVQFLLYGERPKNLNKEGKLIISSNNHDSAVVIYRPDFTTFTASVWNYKTGAEIWLS